MCDIACVISQMFYVDAVVSNDTCVDCPLCCVTQIVFSPLLLLQGAVYLLHRQIVRVQFL